MGITTNQFGTIDFDDDLVITFSSPIFGFEQYKRFIIIDDKDTEPFRWLQSTEEGEVCFPLLDPSLFLDDYFTYFPKNVLKSIEAEDSRTIVMTIVTLKNANGHMTINLKGPLVIDFNENRAQQIILNSEDVSTAYRLN